MLFNHSFIHPSIHHLFITLSPPLYPSTLCHLASFYISQGSLSLWKLSMTSFVQSCGQCPFFHSLLSQMIGYCWPASLLKPACLLHGSGSMVLILPRWAHVHLWPQFPSLFLSLVQVHRPDHSVEFRFCKSKYLLEPPLGHPHGISDSTWPKINFSQLYPKTSSLGLPKSLVPPSTHLLKLETKSWLSVSVSHPYILSVLGNIQLLLIIPTTSFCGSDSHHFTSAFCQQCPNWPPTLYHSNLSSTLQSEPSKHISDYVA